MRGWMVVVGLSASCGTAAWARPKHGEAEEATNAAAMRGPAASAAEIPALAALLLKAGWTPTPELSGVFQAGSIFETTGLGHTLVSATCISAVPKESTYTAAELVTSLQAGVSVGSGPMSGEVQAGIVKKVKFGTPTQVTVPTMDLELSTACREKLRKLSMGHIQSTYVVQEVLKAEIAEQTCGQVDARGRFVGLGVAEAEYAAACAQSSLEPVAVGYRTVPLANLLGLPFSESEPSRGQSLPVSGASVEFSFNASEALAQIQEAKDLETRLGREIESCLAREERKLLTKAATDGNDLALLLKETSLKAKEIGGPLVRRYLDIYGSAEVVCINDLGERRRSVVVPLAAEMSAWLSAVPIPDPNPAAQHGSVVQVDRPEGDSGKRAKVSTNRTENRSHQGMVPTGVEELDSFFGKAQAMLDSLFTAQDDIADAKFMLTNALGIEDNANVGEALIELKTISKGTISLKLVGTRPKLFAKPGSSPTVNRGVTAINGLVEAMTKATGALASMPFDAQALVEEAKDLPRRLPVMAKDSGIKPTQLPKVLKIAGANVKLLGGVPGEAQNTLDFAASTIDLVKTTFSER